MRVLFLTHRLPFAPNRGDRIRSFHTLRLLRQRAMVDVISLVHDDEEAARARNMGNLASSVRIARTSRMGNTVRALALLPTRRPLTHTLLYARELTRHVRDVVAATPPDVVLAYCSGIARVAVEAPLSAYPLVLDMVDVDSAKWRALAGTRSHLDPKRWVYLREARELMRFERLAATHAFATLVINERERVAMEAVAPGARLKIAENGVDLEAWKARSAPTGDPVVVFSGVMNYEPNERAALWFLESVWPGIISQRPDARFVLVGANPTDRLFRAAAKHPSVSITGTVAEVPPFLWQAAMAVAPIFVARGMQNKVLEALAAGLPVVVTPQVMAGLPVDAVSGCIEATDADSFCRTVVALLDLSPDRRRAIAEAADLSALSWQERLRPLLDLVSEAAVHRKPA